MLYCEKSLRTNEAGLTDLALFTIAVIQRNGESVPVCAAGDLAKNQIRAWKIGNDQSGAPFSAGRIRWRKRNGDNFTGYRFDHAASSSGEFQSRARTDSLISTPLKGSFSSESLEPISFWFDAPVFMKQLCHLPRRKRSTRRICCFALRNSAICLPRRSVNEGRR